MIISRIATAFEACALDAHVNPIFFSSFLLSLFSEIAFDINYSKSSEPLNY